MKAEGLRIGNIVHFKGRNMPGSYIPPGEIFVTMDNIQYHHLFEPIPLTEEWLLRFGFKYDKPELTWSIFIGDPENEDDFTLRISQEKYYYGHDFEYGFWYVSKNSIRYVHQLQNLYFALTGEELTLKQ